MEVELESLYIPKILVLGFLKFTIIPGFPEDTGISIIGSDFERSAIISTRQLEVQ